VLSFTSPTDFLLTNYGTIKLADFGLARIYNAEWTQEKLSHQVATRQYRAPELLFASRQYNEKADIWSLSVVMMELILLRTLFPSYNDIDQMAKVFQVIGSPTPERWPVS
jgi:serine/threonine protein kinase